MTAEEFVKQWHRVVSARDVDGVVAMLAENVVFRSPVFWKPQPGKAYAAQLLGIIIRVFDTFEYTKTYHCGRELCFYFEATTMGRQVHGVDLIEIDGAGLIKSLEVMIRPLNGLLALGEKVQSMFSA